MTCSITLRSIFALTLLWTAFHPGWLSAQETAVPAAAEAETQENEQPPALSVTEIPELADTARSELEEILSSLDNTERLTEIVALEGPAFDEIRSSTAEATEDLLSRMGFRRLELVRQEWVRHGERTDRWLSEIDQFAESLQINTTRLVEIREFWTTTRDQLAAAEAVLPAIERAETVISKTGEVESRARQQIGQIVAVQGRLLDAKSVIDQAELRIDDAQRGARHRLAARDTPPLWTAPLRGSGGLTVGASLSTAWQDSLRVVTSFLETDQVGLAIHVSWFVGLLIPMIYLRRRGREWMTGQPALRRAALMLDRPASAALILATLIARWTYRPMPQEYVELLIFLVLIPLIRLLTRFVPAGLRGPLYGFALIFAVDQIQDLAGASLGGRILLLLVALAGLVFVWLIQRDKRLSAPELGRLATVLPTVSWIAFVAFAVSVVANVVGSVALAELMSELVLSGTFISLLFFAGYLVLEGVVGMVLLGPASRALRTIRNHGEAIRSWVLRIARIALAVWWAWGMLALAQLRDPVAAGISAAFVTPHKFGSVTFSLGHLAAGVATLWVSVVLSRVLRVVLEDDVMPRLTMPRGVPSTISMMVRFAVITVGVLCAAAVAGLNLSQFAFVIGALGVGIGFGLQNVVSNFVSGLILIFERPIRVGDTVQTATLYGEVRSIGIRSSRVRTVEGAEVIVPNGNLIAGEVTNWTLSDRLRRIELLVGVAYGTDVHKTEKTLLEVVERHEKVTERPAPVALFRGFGDSSLDFSLRYWTVDSDHWLRIGSQVAMGVNDALKEAGIEIPFPQRDLHFRSVEPAVAGAMTRSRQDLDRREPG